MIKMKDIAKEAGVSIQTVSNIISKKKININKETRKKVLAVVDKYNFKPNRIAQSLRRGSTKTIGLVVPDMVYHPFYPKIFDIMESEFKSKGYNIILFNTREDIEKEKIAIDELNEYKVDGIIFIRIVLENPYLDSLIKNVPIVACLRAFESRNVTSVLVDNLKVGKIATEHLIKKGHKRIIHLAGSNGLQAQRDREEGFRVVMENSNLEIGKNDIIYCDYKDEQLYKKLSGLLSSIENYTAIFAYNDIVAVNCIKVLHEQGLSVPDDISIIGVDNLEIGKLIDPDLTTINQPIEMMCKKSMDLLISIMSNTKIDKHDKNIFYFDAELVERKSVRKIV